MTEKLKRTVRYLNEGWQCRGERVGI